MAEVVYLVEGEDHPVFAEDERWIIIEASNDGKFYGTGSSWRNSGEWVGYGSLCEDDFSLEKALAGAQQWAAKYKVEKIWVQLKPWEA